MRQNATKEGIMGGSGSGNWYRWSKKEIVEDCHVLDVFSMAREGVLAADNWRSGWWSWRNTRTGKEVASVGYEVNTRDRWPWLRLHYTVSPRSSEKQKYDYTIRLQTTPCNYGGRRWWFTCPLTVNGRSCGRRVGKLYLPPNSHYFGCRHCHDLTYESCRKSDKRLSAFRKDPEALLALLQQATQSGDSHALLFALKAIPDDLFQRW
jgi:hypothetical protein